MEEPDNNLQTSKKRAAGVQLTKENPGLDDDNEETSEQEEGTFKRASEEILATRRIVKVRRQKMSPTPSVSDPLPASNPFGAIRLVPPVSDETGKNISISEKAADETKDESIADTEKKVDELEAKLDSYKDKTNINDEHNISKLADEKVEESETAETNNIDNANKYAEDELNNEGKGNAEESEAAETDNIDSKTAETNNIDNVKKDAEDETNKEGKGNAEECETAETDNIDSRIAETNNIDNAKNDAEGEMNNEGKGNAEESETAETDNIENSKKDAEDKTENEGKGIGEVVNTEKNPESTSFGSFQHLSTTQNAFSGLAQTGISATSFTFGSVPQDGALLQTPSASISMPEVYIPTGEENEDVVFISDSVLYEFIDGSWKLRGKGELKLNVSDTGTGKARVIMRAQGNYRLILNACLFPEMKLTEMDKKGVTFACVNMASEEKHGLSTIALKFRDSATAEDFQDAVLEYKSRSGVRVGRLKTPENSPGRTDE